MSVKVFSLELCYQYGIESTIVENESAQPVFCHSLIFRYIYKRLQFLGNKLVSQAVTLVYLAMWHGLATGYYMNFFLEFIMVNTENQVKVVTCTIKEMYLRVIILL